MCVGGGGGAAVAAGKRRRERCADDGRGGGKGEVKDTPQTGGGEGWGQSDGADFGLRENN